jgi:hypothetical protein
MRDYDTHVIENLLQALPKAKYGYIVTDESYIITREQARRIMRVTHIKDHKELLEEFVHWNTMPKSEQRDQECGDNEFCDITTSAVGGTIYLSIHCMSDTESLYLNLHHDTDQVMMDIQLP